MVKTTLYLDEVLDREIKQIARVQKRSQAEVIREALSDYTLRTSAPEPVGIGAFRSGRPDVAEQAEELLWEEGPAVR